MESYLLRLFLGFIFVNGFADGDKFTTGDLAVVQNLGKNLAVQSFVIVNDDGGDLGLVERMKNFSEGNFYFSVVSSNRLKNILASNVSQKSFFQRKTIIAVKETLNLREFLNGVCLPHLILWAIFSRYNDSEKDLFISISNHVLFLNSTPDVIVFGQVFHLKQKSGEVIEIARNWSSNGVNPGSSVMDEANKNNFHNITMDVLTRFSIESCRNFHNQPILTKLACFNQNIFELIARRLNFRQPAILPYSQIWFGSKPNTFTLSCFFNSMSIIVCKDFEHAYSYPNGSEGELLVKLNSGEVDFSVASYVVHRSRLGWYMDYIWPTFVSKSMMYIKQERLSGYWNSYLRPLESSLWWAILFWIFLTGILLQIFEKLLVNDFKLRLSLIFDFIKGVLRAMQIFCNQAVPNIPNVYSIRIIYFLKFFVVILFYQAYCGYLVSCLMFAVPYIPFTDLKGFFENKQYRIITLSKGFHQYFFKKIIGKDRDDSFMLEDDRLPENIQEGIEKLCHHDNLAFVEFKEDLLDVHNFKCKIMEIPSPMARQYIGIGLPVNSPYKEYVNKELIHLYSVGIVHRMRSYLSFHSRFNDDGSEEDFRPVSMAQVYPSFILLAAGILLSAVIFTFEFVIRKMTVCRNLNESISTQNLEKLNSSPKSALRSHDHSSAEEE